jgi:hypothetical protein
MYVGNEGSVRLGRVWGELSANPLGLADVLSGALVAFGVIVGVSVVLKLVHGNEHYPGFAAAGARRRRAFEEYRILKSDCIDRITSLRDVAILDLDDAVELLRNSEFDRQLAVENRTLLYGVYRDYLEHLAGVRRWLVSKYRDTCASAASLPALTDRALTPLAVLVAQPLSPVPDLNQAGRRAAIDRIEGYIARINEKFQETLGTYRPVEELLSTTHGSHATTQ